jgi:NAD(P)H-dependent flavin oxidoreductase YrpB (nitropropane dioxygenase family)
MRWPAIIQGGMGVGVSGWRLARAVALGGELGVVSGTALEVQLARRLDRGDADGSLRQAISRFPNQALAARVLDRYFVPAGRPGRRRSVSVPRARLESPPELVELTVLAAFVEVDLARHGHAGVVGINLLQKIVLPTLPTLYGALLAGVDYVLMGAGIPVEIPAALAALAEHRPASLALPVADDAGDVRVGFDPAVLAIGAPPLEMPRFLPIVSSASLAQILLKRARGPVDGFVIEAPTAGGHNAPPRGQVRVDDRGQPVYGPRDEVDLAAFRSLGLPFWLAGGRGRPGCLAAAKAAGAAGIQVGTAFAFCRESGIEPTLRRAALARVASGTATVFTDPLASPTGFPFKVVDLPGTLAEDALYRARRRRCDLGFLGRACRRPDGRLAFRCPAEPLASWAAKGGAAEESAGRKCLCNALLANIGLGSRTSGGGELPLLTAGDDLSGVRELLDYGAGDYGAADVLRFLLAAAPAPAISDRAACQSAGPSLD